MSDIFLVTNNVRNRFENMICFQTDMLNRAMSLISDLKKSKNFIFNLFEPIFVLFYLDYKKKNRKKVQNVEI